MADSSSEPLRAITYLAPGIPLAFFTAVVDHLGRSLGRRIELASESRISGPMRGDYDPFAHGEADIGFLCSPSFLYLRSLPEPSVSLVPAGFVFDDPRSGGRPHYFSEVVVRRDSGKERLEELRGATFGFNDGCSLSGYFAVHLALRERGAGDGFFGREECTGSHAASIDALLGGELDVATIDSNVLALERERRPELQDELVVVESIGPFPIQPVVVRSGIENDVGSLIETALLNIRSDAQAREESAAFGLVGCASVDDRLYAEEARMLREIESLTRIDP
ncbi:MAG: PhnD/SsuA/transferrin family substrate-binding protein [Planctomycetota bacterium]